MQRNRILTVWSLLNAQFRLHFLFSKVIKSDGCLCWAKGAHVGYAHSFILYKFKILITNFVILAQVSALSDQIGMVDMGVHRGEFDDDE